MSSGGGAGGPASGGGRAASKEVWAKWIQMIQDRNVAELRLVLSNSGASGAFGDDVHTNPSFSGRTLLHHACQQLRPRIVELILEEAPTDDYIWQEQ